MSDEHPTEPEATALPRKRPTLRLVATSGDFQKLSGELKQYFVHKADNDSALYTVEIVGPGEDHPWMEVNLVDSPRPEPNQPFFT